MISIWLPSAGGRSKPIFSLVSRPERDAAARWGRWLLLPMRGILLLESQGSAEHFASFLHQALHHIHRDIVVRQLIPQILLSAIPFRLLS